MNVDRIMNAFALALTGGLAYGVYKIYEIVSTISVI